MVEQERPDPRGDDVMECDCREMARVGEWVGGRSVGGRVNVFDWRGWVNGWVGGRINVFDWLIP